MVFPEIEYPTLDKEFWNNVFQLTFVFWVFLFALPVLVVVSAYYAWRQRKVDSEYHPDLVSPRRKAPVWGNQP